MVCSLSSTQTEMWLAQLMHPRSPLYNIGGYLRIGARLDRRRFEAALNLVVRDHDALRTVLERTDGVPNQSFLNTVSIHLPLLDFSKSEDAEKSAIAWMRSELRKPFQLYENPLFEFALCKISENLFFWFCKYHHIILDGWAMTLIVRRVADAYNAAAMGHARTAPQLYSYRSFLLAEENYLSSSRLRKAENFWLDTYRELPQPLLNGAPSITFRTNLVPSKRVSCNLRHDLYNGLRDIADQCSASCFHVLLSTLYCYFVRAYGRKDLAFGLPSLNRPTDQFKQTVGLFMGLTPAWFRFGDQMKFTELVASIRDELYRYRTLRHGLRETFLVPIARLNQKLGLHRMGRRHLFDVRVSYLKHDYDAIHFDGGPVDFFLLDHGLEQDPLALFVYELHADKDVRIEADYNEASFNEAEIDAILDRWQTLIEGVVAKPDARLCELRLLSDTTRKRLTRSGHGQQDSPLSDTFREQDTDQSLPARFAAQVAAWPDRLAVKTRELAWTYAELGRRADAVSAGIYATLGPGPGRVALLMSNVPAAISAILGVLKAGRSYVPLDPAHPERRLRVLLRDADVDAVLVDPAHADLAEGLIASTAVVLDAEQLLCEYRESKCKLDVVPDTHAYLLYTSGSTGSPKGVVQTHRNVLCHIRAYTNQLRIDAKDRLTLLPSLGFDAAVMDIFGALLNGAALFPMSAREDLPRTLVDWIRDQNITIYHSTPTIYRTLLSTLAPQERLPSVRFIVLGGEEAHSMDAEGYRRHFGDGCLLINGLGPTESTLALQYVVDHKTEISGTTIPVGYPVPGTEVLLLDEEQRDAEVHGEIAIRSRNLAIGYWRRPRLTESVFLGDRRGDKSRLYLTGDRGRLRPDGSIEFLGRKDSQIKLRGIRIEPGEIESLLIRQAGVLDAVVTLHQTDAGDKRLVAYAVNDGCDVRTGNELRESLKSELPDYLVPAHVVMLDSLPLTPHGKIDRAALPPPVWQPITTDFAPPEHPIQEILSKIFADVLGVEQVDIHDDFFALGGHSLLATRVVSRVQRAFRVDLPLPTLFRLRTVSELTREIETMGGAAEVSHPTTIPVYPRNAELALSFSQARLWFLDQLEPGGKHYNLPCAIRLRGPLQHEALAGAINEIIQRHESLRTRYTDHDGVPTQEILPRLTVVLPITDLRDRPAAEREANAMQLVGQGAQKAFDLKGGELFRAQLLRLGEHDHIFSVTMHHIASDAWSLTVFFEELSKLYECFMREESSPLPALAIQYADFAAWQRQWLKSEEFARQLSYWRARLADLPVLELPTDHDRPPLSTHSGSTYTSYIPRTATAALRALGQQEDVTLYMTLLAAFQALLYRYTNQEDIVVGSPIAGRNRVEIEGLIGFFANILVLRTDLSGDPSFRALLGRVRAVCLEAYQHADLPFEKLVEELRPARDPSRNPLFQVMFALHREPVECRQLGEAIVDPLPVETGSAKFDLSLTVVERSDDLQLVWYFSRDLFDHGTIARMAGHFEILVQGLISDATCAVSGLPLLTAAEHRQLVTEWNQTQVHYPHARCVHELFETQAACTPNRVAVTSGDRVLTYGVLNAKANRVARALMAAGIGRGKYVPLMMDSCPELVIGILAVLKTGAAYAPIDPNWPMTRRVRILSQLGGDVVLVDRKRDISNDLACWTWVSVADAGTTGPATNLAVDVAADDPIYVIFTSGSTGIPKGAINRHRGITNRLCYMNARFGQRDSDVILQTTPPWFDSSVWQLYWPLMNGARTILLASDGGFDLDNFVRLIERERVTVTDLVPSVLNIFVEWLERNSEQATRLYSLRQILVGGEAMRSTPVSKFKAFLPNVNVTNAYGPTETSIGVLFYDVPARVPDIIPIGRPIDNVNVFVLDNHCTPVPIGVPGELYLGGACVGLGYLGNDEETQAAFVDNPFTGIGGGTETLYRTGDVVRFLPDGNIQFIGRKDQQIELRGRRIEPREIETELCEHEAVVDAVVVMDEDPRGNQHLVAYVVCDQRAAITAHRLRGVLRNVVPAYMVPDKVMFLDQLPLLANGKLDRRALPKPEWGKRTEQGDLVAPSTEAQQAVAALWSDLFGIQQISIHDNFFELGGHSLMAVQLVSRLRAACQVDVSLRSVFECPTLEALAHVVANAPTACGSHTIPRRERRLERAYRH